jgi:hypothetical protein
MAYTVFLQNKKGNSWWGHENRAATAEKKSEIKRIKVPELCTASTPGISFVVKFVLTSDNIS